VVYFKTLSHHLEENYEKSKSEQSGQVEHPDLTPRRWFSFSCCSGLSKEMFVIPDPGS